MHIHQGDLIPVSFLFRKRTVRKFTIPTGLVLIASVFVLAMIGCSDSKKKDQVANPQQTNSPKSTPANAIDACSLLTTKEIESIQGAAVKEVKPSAKAHEGFTVSQCFFLLPKKVDSIVVSVTQRGEGTDAVDPKKWWDDNFHPKGEKTDASPNEFKHDEPEKIDGVGDEAFWASPRFGGAFFVQKENAFVRISIGGSASKEEKIRKAKALAEIILKRL